MAGRNRRESLGVNRGAIARRDRTVYSDRQHIRSLRARQHRH
jgi:hypothetical protein